MIGLWVVGTVEGLLFKKSTRVSGIGSRATECVPPFGPKGGDQHSLADERVGEPNTDEGTVTLVLYVYYNISMVGTKEGSNRLSGPIHATSSLMYRMKKIGENCTYLPGNLHKH